MEFYSNLLVVISSASLFIGFDGLIKLPFLPFFPLLIHKSLPMPFCCVLD